MFQNVHRAAHNRRILCAARMSENLRIRDKNEAMIPKCIRYYHYSKEIYFVAILPLNEFPLTDGGIGFGSSFLYTYMKYERLRMKLIDMKKLLIKETK